MEGRSQNDEICLARIWLQCETESTSGLPGECKSNMMTSVFRGFSIYGTDSACMSQGQELYC